MIASKILLRALPAVATALAASTAMAQSPATPASPDETRPTAYELSPFEVSAAANRGYVSSESMTGSRVATKILDLPFSVNVLTSELFDDFALFELNENVAYIGGFTGLDQGGGFNLRGFNATNQLRDGFFRLGRYGSSNVDRIEVIRGPNAAIYGQTSPGGMLNMISKKPRKTPGYRLSVSGGDYDSLRTALEATGPLNFLGDTSYITTLGYYNRGYETPMSELTNSEAYIAVQHEFADRSTFMVQLEYFLREVASPTSSAPFILNDQNTTATADDRIVGIAKELGTLQQFGPHSELNRGMVFLTGTYEKVFNPTFSTRVSSNYYRARRWDFNQNVTAAQVNQRTLVMQRGATPNKGIIFEDGGGVQADLLAHYWLGNRSIENRTLLTFDYNVYYRYDPNWNLAGPALAAWTPLRNITVNQELTAAAAPIGYIPNFFQWTGGSFANGRKNKNRILDVGTLLRQQMGFMENRLLVFGGARFDRVSYNLRDLAASRQSQFTFEELKPNLGANFAVRPNLRVFANYSESFFPNQQFITAASITPDYESESAAGFDYGFKGSLLDGRLDFTATGFRIERENVVVREINPVTGIEENRPEGDHLVQGFELDLNYRVTDEFSLLGSFGYVDSAITDFGIRTAVVGRSPARISPMNGGLTLKWEPVGGPLKGWSTNLGVTYLAKTPVSAGDAGQTFSATGAVLTDNKEWDQRVPGVTVMNLGLGYRFAASGNSRLRHTVRLNVNNIADKFFLQPNRQVGDRRTFILSYIIDR